MPQFNEKNHKFVDKLKDFVNGSGFDIGVYLANLSVDIVVSRKSSEIIYLLIYLHKKTVFFWH